MCRVKINASDLFDLHVRNQIWDMSAQNHTPRLVTTLYANRPIGYIRWHTSSSRPFDLVVVPQSTSGSSASIGSSTDGHWLPDIEIWDVRRTFLPKETIWSGSSVIGERREAPRKERICQRPH